MSGRWLVVGVLAALLVVVSLLWGGVAWPQSGGQAVGPGSADVPVVAGQSMGEVFGAPPLPGAQLAGAGGSWVDWRLPGGQVLT